LEEIVVTSFASVTNFLNNAELPSCPWSSKFAICDTIIVPTVVLLPFYLDYIDCFQTINSRISPCSFIVIAATGINQQTPAGSRATLENSRLAIALS
jgi:hypothetical protein